MPFRIRSILAQTKRLYVMPILVRRSTKVPGRWALRVMIPDYLSGIPVTIGGSMRLMTSIPTVRG